MQQIPVQEKLSGQQIVSHRIKSKRMADGVTGCDCFQAPECTLSDVWGRPSTSCSFIWTDEKEKSCTLRVSVLVKLDKPWENHMIVSTTGILLF